MGYRGTTAEQPSDQSEDEPYVLRLDHVLLVTGIISLTVAVLLAILDNVAKADYIRGIYSILTGWFVVGIVGWQVRSGQARVRRMVESHARAIDDQLAELTSAVGKLRDEAGQAHVTYLPTPKSHQGHRYVGSVPADREADTVPLMPRVDRPQPADRDAVLEEGFELGYRARSAEENVTKLPAPKRRLMRDS